MRKLTTAILSFVVLATFSLVLTHETFGSEQSAFIKTTNERLIVSQAMDIQPQLMAKTAYTSVQDGDAYKLTGFESFDTYEIKSKATILARIYNTKIEKMPLNYYLIDQIHIVRV